MQLTMQSNISCKTTFIMDNKTMTMTMASSVIGGTGFPGLLTMLGNTYTKK